MNSKQLNLFYYCQLIKLWKGYHVSYDMNCGEK